MNTFKLLTARYVPVPIDPRNEFEELRGHIREIMWIKNLVSNALEEDFR